jgi:uncharacterized protein
MMLTALALAASAPSFDCAKAKTSVEKMICGDEGLARSDQAVAMLYRFAPRKAQMFPHDQREWLEMRDRCTDRACLIDAYEERIWDLVVQARSGVKSYGRRGDVGTLSVVSLGGGWFAFSAIGLSKSANDTEASGVFKLVNGKAQRSPSEGGSLCGWRIQRLPRDRWKLEEWPGKGVIGCGGLDATVSGIYSR